MVAENVGIVPFLDGGMVYRDEMPQIIGDMDWGTGLGFRYYTPIGPVRLDVATPLHVIDDDPRVQFYISIGQSFLMSAKTAPQAEAAPKKEAILLLRSIGWFSRALSFCSSCFCLPLAAGAIGFCRPMAARHGWFPGANKMLDGGQLERQRCVFI